MRSKEAGDPADRNPWWIVAGAVLGLTVSSGPILQFTFGVFLKPLTSAFASDRVTISLAILVGLGATAIATPVVGHLIDRFGIRPVALPAITLFAAAIATVGLAPATASQFIFLYGLLGLAAAGQSPLPYARAVAEAFDRKRGLALGVSMAGVGLGTALLPQVAQALIGSVGWRMAYVGLAAMVFVLAFPSIAFLVGPRRVSVRRTNSDLPGATGAEALHTATFWMLAASFFCVSVAASGVIAHIVSLLGDHGVSPRAATAALSGAGLALIAGRLFAGYLLDRIFGPYVALGFFLAPLLGVLLLLVAVNTPTAIAAAVLVGIGLGAEIDLIAYLLSRYLGMRAFGQIYGYLFAVFTLGSGIGPVVMGSAFERTGGYQPALVGFAVSLALACLLVTRLGPYRFAGPNE